MVGRESVGHRTRHEHAGRDGEHQEGRPGATTLVRTGQQSPPYRFERDVNLDRRIPPGPHPGDP